MKDQKNGNIARQQEAIKTWEPRRAEVLTLYVNGGLSQNQMAARYGVTQAAFQKALKRMGLPAKSRWRSGPQNWRFKDGSTAYRAMIQKDHCNRCGTTAQLVIHHKDGVHTNNTPDNLEVLCSPCHTSHHKQEWWDSRKACQSYGSAMTTAKSIAVALGRRRIAAAVGVVRTAVSNAIVRDKQFPASWYVAVSRLCAEDGIECPPELFGMRGISDKGQ